MTLRRTALWCAAGSAILLGVAALTVALAVYRPALVRPWAQRALTPRGGTASLASLKISLTPPTIVLSGLVIAGPPRDGDLMRLDHLQFELIPGRFFHGGPWLRHLEARGVVFERPRPRETEGPPDLTPLTRLFDIEDLSLTDARLRVAMPQGVLAVDRLRLRLTPGEGGMRAFAGSGDLSFRGKGSPASTAKLSARGTVTPELALSVDLESASGHLELPWISGDLSGRTRLRMTRKNFQVEELVLTLPQGRVNLGPRRTILQEPVRLNAAAGATLVGRDPRLEVRELDIGGLLVARGRLGGPTLDKMSGTLEGEITRLERVRTYWAPLLPAPLADMELTGRLPWRLSLSTGSTDRLLTLDLLPADLGLSLTSAGLGGRFGGSLKAAGSLDGWLHGSVPLSGRLRGTGHFDRPPLAVRRFRFDAPFAGAMAALTLPGWVLSAGPGEVLYEGRPLPLGTVAIRGSASPVDDSYRVEGVEIRSDSLGRLTGQVAFHGGNVSGRLDEARLPADNLVSIAQAVSGREWNGWSATGAIDVAARLEPAEGGPRLAATAVLGRIGFTSPAGDAMGRNLAGNVDLQALLIHKPRLNVDLVLRGGEALWGTVYLDLAKDPLDLHVGGTRGGPEVYEELLLEGGSPRFGRLRIEGKARRESERWRHQGRIALRDARLGPIFRTFLRDPLAASQPDLAGLEMEGAAGVDLSFSGSGKAADLDGTFRLRSGDLHRGAEPPLLEGLNIDLPISYSFGAANPGLPSPSDAANWGRLRLEKIRLSGQELGPLEVPVILVPNRLYLGGAIDASLYGANLSLRRIRVDEPLSMGFRIRMAAELDGLDLSRIAGDNSVFEGRLAGILDPVILDRERVTAAGRLTGDLFGGRLDVARVTVERPFSAGREIGADVNVDRIDLERFSAALGVGRITGRLSGEIKGLRVAYGQPVAFDLKMESVPAEGVNQTVSLKAVNSISLISTGSPLSGMGISLMATFFREFPYEKIGFGCGLKNDVFTVRGLIHQDGVEYLVKRRFLTGIDVINGNPDNHIGFSDMLERAKRVTGERTN
ncbi:hypothetical protein [Candidatus Deferrimicrobium sp.]|uniref:hypothetical protein n=1 Tax=Candidatus Deferrimicrobium sp. TaxID=3060586 RepID=UPI003C63EBF9